MTSAEIATHHHVIPKVAEVKPHFTPVPESNNIEVRGSSFKPEITQQRQSVAEGVGFVAVQQEVAHAA